MTHPATSRPTHLPDLYTPINSLTINIFDRILLAEADALRHAVVFHPTVCFLSELSCNSVKTSQTSHFQTKNADEENPENMYPNFSQLQQTSHTPKQSSKIQKMLNFDTVKIMNFEMKHCPGQRQQALRYLSKTFCLVQNNNHHQPPPQTPPNTTISQWKLLILPWKQWKMRF